MSEAVKKYYNIPEAELEKLTNEEELGNFENVPVHPETIPGRPESADFAKWCTEQLDYRGARVEQLRIELRAMQLKNSEILSLMESEEKFITDRIEWHIRNIQQIMPPSVTAAFVGDRVRLFYKESTSTEIYDSESIPLEFCEMKQEIKKALIKEHLENGGDEVLGARLNTKLSLQIKPGGERAKMNQKNMEKRHTKALIADAVKEF